ncbi:MAG: exosortase/archaeosortase family protein [Euryarchaeota archaeon]|nr:exosortase/archaeosortase family protein [Euryarchaeota archaeon]MCG2737577.1 exosortase/archaeosortase family protein [Candidatus Methanoperedenaceae archaeon]
MERTTQKKIIYAVCSSIFIIGLLTTLSWQYTSRWIGLALLVSSLSVMYYTYRKDQKEIAAPQEVNLKLASLGLLLILTDLAYNIIVKDEFRYFDYGMILAGIFIVLLNINWLSGLKIEKQMVLFSSYFVFITMVMYGFFFKGVQLLLGETSSGSNPLWDWFSNNVVMISMPILNLIGRTTADSATISFNGFTVGIGYACSGIESISVFASAVIAYFISINNKEIKKMLKYILIGGAALYIMNILRVIILILTGYYYGVDSMMFVHANLGWILFVIGMSIFWYLVFQDKDLKMK